MVDTSVWVAAFRQPRSVIAQEVDRLLATRQVLSAGVIVAEVLQGARDAREFARLLEHFVALPFLEPDRDNWIRTGELGFQLSRQGTPIPIVDALIAVLALEDGHAVFTYDDHFRRVPGLQLHAI